MTASGGSDESTLRGSTTIEERVADCQLTIDAGVVNHRKIETIVGAPGRDVIDTALRQLPDMPAWQRGVRIDKVYTDVLLTFCQAIGVGTLSSVLAAGRGQLFCSVEQLEPTKGIYDAQRVVTRVISPGSSDIQAELHYSTDKVRASTTKSQLESGGTLALVGAIEGHKPSTRTVIVRPLVMGSPWLSDPTNTLSSAEWYGQYCFENFIEDIDEFALTRDVENSADFSVCETYPRTPSKPASVKYLAIVFRMIGVARPQIITQRTSV